MNITDSNFDPTTNSHTSTSPNSAQFHSSSTILAVASSLSLFSSTTLHKKKPSQKSISTSYFSLDSSDAEDLTFLDQFRFIDGRQYHNEKNAHYYLPNDKQESDRLRIQHYVVHEIWKGNYSSPIKQRLIDGNTNVLDIGCGPGTWILDMGTTYPSSTFIGIDFSPVFPNSSFTPPNSIFLRHNILERLPFPDSSFDFVFQRFLAMSFDEVGWNDLFTEIVRVMKQDGWLEMMNFGCELKNPGPCTKRLADAVIEFHESKDIKVPTSIDLRKCFEQTRQITDISIEEKHLPLGKWAGQVGQLAKTNFNSEILGLKPFLLPFMNVTSEEFQLLLDNSDAEVNDYQTSLSTYRVFGRKVNDEQSKQMWVQYHHSL
ncbi:12005_t:CDS:2 [Acaulospora morrowiae]|uniref:12005_t:CDS:1 n=1 Tax=Acaulospora morrowiae TaxID=94023 RepID=A0A9N9GS71_9GLOM|nr:12005_t:CDS:2 [Acaulospora morrowiae]